MAKILPFEAVILAGGLGTRLRSVVSDKPKVMAAVEGAPFLSWILKAIRPYGVRRVILCVGYLSEQIEAHFGSKFEGIDIVYSRETSPMGTGGALTPIASLMQGESLYVLNGDSWCVTDLGEFARDFINTNAEVSVVLAKVNNSGRYGSVVFDENRRVTSFKEKCLEDAPGWINAGIYIVSKKKMISIADKQGAFSLEKDTLPIWVSEGMTAFPSNGLFLDIGTPESFSQAGRFIDSINLKAGS